MTFQQHDSISFLNLPYAEADDDMSPDGGNNALDDLFLNFPYDFTFEEDATADAEPARTRIDSLLQPDLTTLFGEKQDALDLSAQYTLDTLPRAATMGPHKLAATPSTALALLQRKQQYLVPGNAVSSLSMPPVKEKRDADDLDAAIEGDFDFDTSVFLSEPLTKKQRVSSESDSSSRSPPSFTTSQPESVKFDIPTPPSSSGPLAPDKRLRNNQASARFRAKKKMREMQVENTARDAIIRAEILERRVKEMEMEVKWLRGLVAGGNGDNAKPESGRTVKALKQIYAENGVVWRDGSLQVVANGPAVSGGTLPPPSWGVTEEGEVYALPVATNSMDSLSAQLAELQRAQTSMLPTGLSALAAMPVQLALPPPAKRGRPPKKMVNVPNVSQPVATLGKVAMPGGLLVSGLNLAGLLPLLVQPMLVQK